METRIVPGPSDESLRRAGLIRYAEDGQNVPEKCRNPATYDEETSKYSVPIATQECIIAITGKKTTDIYTAEDDVKVIKWWAANAKDTSQSQWLLVSGPLLSFVNDPIATIPKGEYIVSRIKTPTEDLSNEIAGNVGDIFGFLTDPQSWLSMGALIIGGILVFVGMRRYLSGT